MCDQHAGQVGPGVRAEHHVHADHGGVPGGHHCRVLCVGSVGGPVGLGERVLHPGCRVLCLVAALDTAGFRYSRYSSNVRSERKNFYI